MNRKDSYTSANSLPLKMIKDTNLVKRINDTGSIPPNHIQICPTNKCNLSCTFCSCSEREKGDELSKQDLFYITNIAYKLGTKAFTITGGGEPTLSPSINEFIDYTHSGHGIDLGLVTNGLTTNRLRDNSLDSLVWVRTSFDDNRKFDKQFQQNQERLSKHSPKIDLAFSYVVGTQPNDHNLKAIINFANEHKYTHVRLVPDLYKTNDVAMKSLEYKLKNEIDCQRVIFQDRQEYTTGDKHCQISLLKPLIAPNGFVYPCCGVQYALKDISKQKAFPDEMRMGHFIDLPQIIYENEPFNGSNCEKCYYQNYNTILNAMKKDYEHEKFL